MTPAISDSSNDNNNSNNNNNNKNNATSLRLSASSIPRSPIDDGSGAEDELAHDQNHHHRHRSTTAPPNRYSDFTTVDWVQDALQTHTRRRLASQQKVHDYYRNHNRARAYDDDGSGGTGRSAPRRIGRMIGYGYGYGGGGGLRSRLRRTIFESYEAGQAWVVVSLVGLAIGLNSAVLNVVTEWLSDVKLGYCRDGFYLNQQFCCWGVEGGGMCVRARFVCAVMLGMEHRLPTCFHPFHSP